MLSGICAVSRQTVGGHEVAPMYGTRHGCVSNLPFDLRHEVQILKSLTGQIRHRRRKGLEAEYIPITGRSEDLAQTSEPCVEVPSGSRVQLPLEQLKHGAGFADGDAHLMQCFGVASRVGPILTSK